MNRFGSLCNKHAPTLESLTNFHLVGNKIYSLLFYFCEIVFKLAAGFRKTKQWKIHRCRFLLERLAPKAPARGPAPVPPGWCPGRSRGAPGRSPGRAWLWPSATRQSPSSPSLWPDSGLRRSDLQLQVAPAASRTPAEGKEVGLADQDCSYNLPPKKTNKQTNMLSFRYFKLHVLHSGFKPFGMV